jgi:tryptophanyl-tRNA synthetase
MTKPPRDKGISVTIAEPVADQAATSTKPVVFSGIQPSGYLTLGNYLGAIRNWVDDQDRYANIFAIVDMHAISIPRERAELSESIETLATTFLACGLDTARSTIFVQGDIDEHAVLCWMLNAVTPIGWLNRMTQFKSKSATERGNTTAALFDYPVLMAADILMYDANYVPVGDDQKQHVELTRDIAERFNSMYGPTFVVPQPLIRKVGARIMSLTDPTSKMSKSEPEGAIGLLDDPAIIRKKIMRAQTDSFRDVVFDPSRIGLFNLLEIYQLLSGMDQSAIETHFEGRGYGDLKRELAELVVEALVPIQTRYTDLRKDPSYVRGILRNSADSMRPIAEATIQKVKDRMGLGAVRVP